MSELPKEWKFSFLFHMLNVVPWALYSKGNWILWLVVCDYRFEFKRNSISTISKILIEKETRPLRWTNEFKNHSMVNSGRDIKALTQMVAQKCVTRLNSERKCDFLCGNSEHWKGSWKYQCNFTSYWIFNTQVLLFEKIHPDLHYEWSLWFLPLASV